MSTTNETAEFLAEYLKALAPNDYMGFVDFYQTNGFFSPKEINRLLQRSKLFAAVYNKYPPLWSLPLSKAQEDYYHSPKKVVVLSGANQSGKSHWGPRPLIRRAFGALEHISPLKNTGLKLGHETLPPLQITDEGYPVLWFCTTTGSFKLRMWEKYIQPLIGEPDSFIFPWKMKTDNATNPSRVTFYEPGDTQMAGKPIMLWIFKSYDEERRRFQMDAISGLHYDEEPTLEIWKEAFMRTVVNSAPITMSATFYECQPWINKELYIPSLDPNSDIALYKSSVLENKTLSKEQLDIIIRQYQGNPWEFRVRVLGEIDFFSDVSRAFFPLEHIARAQLTNKPPILSGHFNPTTQKDRAQATTLADIIPQPGGNVAIWEPPAPDHTYIMGVDSSAGVPNGDFSVAWVYCQETRRFVARFRDRIPPHKFKFCLVQLAAIYNRAYALIELAGPGHTLVQQLIETDTDGTSLYWDDRMLRQRTQTENTQGIAHFPGYRMGERSRETLLDSLLHYLGSDEPVIPDEAAIQQLKAFIIHSSGKAKAADGNHDDDVIALGLCTVTDPEFCATGGILGMPRIKEAPPPPDRRSVYVSDEKPSGPWTSSLGISSL